MVLTCELAKSGPPAPLSIGAADGWVLTDWLENLLAALAKPPTASGPDQYENLLDPLANWRAAPVPDAFERLGRLWGIQGAFPDGPERALLTQFGESVIDVVARDRAVMVFEADFVTTVVANDFPEAAGQLKAFRFPEVDGNRPLVVGGDAMVVFRNSSVGLELVNWLTDGAEPFLAWIQSGGYLSPNKTIQETAYPPGQPRRFVRDLQDPNQRPHFDLSDRLPGALGGGPGFGMWQILQDFFAAAADGKRNVKDPVKEAVDRLAAIAARASG